MENISIIVTEGENDEMNVVMKNIYSTCDIDNRNSVEVSKLIEFIKPYMIQDLSALETLKLLLDPNNENVCVTSETFYNAMNDWAKRFGDSSDDLDNSLCKSLGCSTLDDGELPFVQSTPRTSFGKKLLNCSELISLSFNSSSMENNTLDVKVALEEEVKRMNLQLNKMSNETITLKLQLHSAEEQVELLQTDLELANRRLQTEQQVNEQLQREQREFEELQEELLNLKNQNEILHKKQKEFEKENQYLNKFVTKLEEEKCAIERKIESLTRNEQNAKTRIIDVETELELKEQQLSSLLQANDDIKVKLMEQKDIIDQFTNEIELLTHKKEALETLLRNNVSNPIDKSYYQSFKNTSRSSLGSQGKKSMFTSAQSPELNMIFNYNNTLLLRQLSNPLSPSSLNSPICNQINKVVSVDSQHNACILTSTPKTEEVENTKELGSLPDNQISTDLHSQSKPVMYVVERTPYIFPGDISMENNNENGELRDQSSDEDLFWKLQDVFCNSKDENRFPLESLHTEICKVSLGMENAGEANQNGERITELEEEKESLLRNLDEHKSSIDMLNTEMQSLKVELNAIQKEKDILLEKLSKLEFIENDLKDSRAKIVNLTTYNKLFENDSENLQDRIKKLENTLSSMQRVEIDRELLLKSKEDKIVSLQQTITESQSTLQQKLIYIEQLKNDISNLILKNQELEHSMNKIQQELIDSKTENIKIKELNSKIETTLNSIDLNLVKKATVVSDLEELNKKLQTNIESNSLIIRQKFDEIFELRAALKTDNEIKNSLWEDIQSLSAELLHQRESMESQVRQQKEDYEKLSKEFKELQQQYNDLVIKSNHFETKLGKEMLGNNTLLKEIDFLKTQFNSKEDELKTIKTIANMTERKLESFIKESEIQHKELIKLQTALQEEKEHVKAMENVANQKDSCIEQMKKETLNKENNLQELVVKLSTFLGISQEQSKTDSVINNVNNLINKVLLNANEKSSTSPDLERENKKGSFEKQRLRIEKLQEKLEQSEEFCQITKNKMQQISKQRDNLLEFSQQYQLEKVGFEKEIVILRNDLQQQTVHCNKLQQMYEEKIAEFTDYKDLMENLHNVIENKTMEIEKLNKMIKDLEFQKLCLEDKLKLASLKKAEPIILDNSTDLENLTELEKKLKGTKCLLESSEMELNVTTMKLNNVKEELVVLTREISNNTSTVCRSTEKLSSLVNNWIKYFVSNDSLEGRRFLEAVKSQSMEFRSFSSSVEEGICKLENIVELSVALIEVLACKFEKSSEECDMDEAIENVAKNISPDSNTKNFKKFTLRPPRLIINHPDSPDSPSMEIGLSGDPTCLKSLFRYENDIHNSASTINCGLIERNFNAVDDETIPPTQEVFPNLSESFLNSIGLNETSSLQNLSKDETERLFTTLIIQQSLDAKDTQLKQDKQMERCGQLEDKFQTIIKQITYRLRDHQCIGAHDSINTVFVLLEEMKLLIKELISSAGLYGALCYETRMMKCWNLVTNYTAILRQDVNNGLCSPKDDKSNILDENIETSTLKSRVKRKAKVFAIENTNPDSKNVAGQRSCFWRVSKFALLLMSLLTLFTALLVLQTLCDQSGSTACSFGVLMENILTGDPPY